MRNMERRCESRRECRCAGFEDGGGRMGCDMMRLNVAQVHWWVIREHARREEIERDRNRENDADDFLFWVVQT